MKRQRSCSTDEPQVVIVDDGQNITATQTFCQGYGLTISKKDHEIILDRTKVCRDEVIDFTLKSIYFKQAHSIQNQTLLLDCFFFSDLLSKKQKHHRSIQKKLALFFEPTIKYIIVPICLSGHFSSFVFVDYSSTKSGSCICFDSMINKYHNSSHFFQEINRYFIAINAFTKNIASFLLFLYTYYSALCKHSGHHDKPLPKYLDGNTKCQQKYSNDCGPILCQLISMFLQQQLSTCEIKYSIDNNLYLQDNFGVLARQEIKNEMERLSHLTYFSCCRSTMHNFFNIIY
jgi:hypothetical protein